VLSLVEVVVSSGCGDIPGQQLFDAVGGVLGDAREHVAQVSPRPHTI